MFCNHARWACSRCCAQGFVMPFDARILAELDRKLEATHIRQRLGSGGIMLDYLEGWFVIQEANRIFGHDGWSRETLILEPVGPPAHFKNRSGREQWKVGYRAVVRVAAHGVVRHGSGFGNGIGPDPVDVHELAVQEAETDAMKRALATFGKPFGLALYDKTRANVLSPEDSRVAVNESDSVDNLDTLTRQYHDEMEGLKTLYPQKYQNLREKIIAPKRARLQAAVAGEGNAPSPVPPREGAGQSGDTRH
jgi:DNA recombination protein Rad52